MKLLRTSVLLASILSASALSAAPGDLDPTFLTGIGAGLTPSSYPTFDNGTGATNAVALQSNGKILAGGNISKFNNTGELTALKRLNADGTLDLTFNAPGGTPGAGLAATTGQAEVNALLVAPDDKIYVGGTFNTYNGTNRGSFLRLNADGTLDETFAFTQLGGSVRYVHAIALQPDGKVIIAGAFTSAAGVARINLARLNPNGTNDATFTPSGYSTNGGLRALQLAPDGKLYVGGTTYNPTTQRNDPILHRLNPDGSRDLTFNPVFAPDYGAVNSLLLLPDGRILAGSDLPLPGYSQPVGLAAFNPDGSLDTAFMTKIAGEANGGALTLKLTPEGNILMGGIFTRFAGLPRASIVRLAPDGTVDPTFAPQPYAGRDTGYLTHLYSFAVQPDGRILAGGWFNRISDPDLAIYSLVRFEGDYTAGPGRVGLTSPTYTFNENAGTVSISVARFGGITGAVSVDYSLTAGTATADDLALTSGTLSWAHNEGGIKTFTVALTNDALAESLEAAVLTLSNLTGGATLGTSLGVVAIRDDDSLPAIVLQPIAVTLDQGETFSLYVGYDSVLPATAQWYLGDTLIPGATGPVYTVGNADPAVHAGNYSVRVTNPNGTTTSLTVSVVIGIPAGALVTTFNPTLALTSVNTSGFDPLGNFLLGGANGLLRMTPAGVIDPSFAPVFNQAVYTLVPLPDGSSLVGGFFTSINSTTKNYFARILADGTLDTAVDFGLTQAVNVLSLGANNKLYLGHGGSQGLKRYSLSGTNGVLDTTFVTTNLVTGTGGSVFNVKERADGKVFLSSQSGANGFGFTYQFRLLTSTGAVDPSFTPPTLNWTVHDWEILPDGRIVIVGRFSTVNGVTSRAIAILHADGSLDTSVDFSGAFVGNLTGVRYVNGRLVVWGAFTSAFGQTLNGVARLNLDGTLDPTFKVGTGTNAAVNTAQFLPDGDLFLGGSFSIIRNQSRSRVALLEAGPGAVGLAPATLTVSEGVGAVTLTLKRYGSPAGSASINYTTTGGTATAGADFTAASGTITWADGDATDKTITVSVTQDTAIESSEKFQVTLSNPVGNITGAGSAVVTITDDDTPVTITTQPTGASLTEGQALTLTAAATSPTAMTFQWYRNNEPIPSATASTYTVAATGGADVGSYFLRITNAAGFVDTATVTVAIALDPARRVSNFNFTTAITGNVRAIASIPGGGAYVGGDFNSVPGLTSGGYLMRVNDDGSLDTTFNPRPNGSVVTMARQPDGKLVIGGAFNQVGGVARGYVARLHADGTLDTAFSTALGTGPNFNVNSLTLLPDGRIVVGGSFTSINSISGTSYLAVLKADGSLDTSFVSAANSTVNAVAVQPDGKILIGGAFTSYNVRLGRISDKGVLDLSFAGSGAGSNSNIAKIVVLPDQRIAVMGTNLIGGSDFEILNTDGTVAQNISTFSTFYDVVAQDNGKLVAVGSFSISGGTRIARFTPSGSPATYAIDTTFATGTGLNNTTYAIALTQTGNLWIGGAFTSYNSASVNRLIKLNGEPVAVAITSQPADLTVNPGATLNFSVSALGTAELTYQWRKDGVDLVNSSRISGATSASLAITGATDADEGNYTVVVTNSTAGRTATSRAAAVVVLGAPEILVAPGATETNTGGTLTLSATVRGAAPLTYEWRRNGQLVANGGRISGADSATLTITGSEITDGGTYTFTVINSLGTATTQSFDVSVLVLPGLRVPAFASLAANSNVHHILPLPDGGALVAGNFTANGLTGANSTRGGPYLARVKPNGEIDSTFTVTPNSDVHRLAFAPDGGVIATGYFTQVNGLAKNRLLRLNPDLTLDLAWTPTGFSLAGITKALAVDSTGRIYVGATYSGFSNAYLPIAERFLPNGTKDTTFEWGGNNSIYHIDDIVIDAQDRVLIAGNSQASTGSQGLMRVLPTGGIDPTFPLNAIPSGSSIAYQIALQSDGKIVVASTSSPGLRRLTADGATDNTFSNYSNPVSDFAVLHNDRLVAVGSSLFNNGVNYIVRLEPNGAATTFPGPTTGFNSGPERISVAETGTLWINGGFFTTYNGQTVNYLVALNGDVPNLHISKQPIGSQVVDPAATVTFTARAVGTSTIAYQWLKDGVALTNGGRIAGADTATLTLTGALAGDSASYTLRVTNDTGGTRTSAASRLIVRDAPVVTGPLQSLYRTSGSSATFSVGVVGAGTLSYQWNKNGTAIPGAEGPTFTIPSVNRTDAGLYSVTITNSLGTVTTPAAALSVGTMPDYSPVKITTGGSFDELKVTAKLPDGRYYVAGNFSSIGGHATYGVARFLANGAVDTSFVSPFTGGTPSAMAAFPDGRVFVWGLVTNVSFTGHQLVNADGTSATFSSTALSNITGTAQHAVVGADGNLYVSYGYANSASNRPLLAKISPTGEVLATFTGDGSAAIYDFAFLSGGRIAVAGSWTKSSVQRYVDILDASFAPDPTFAAALTLNARVFDLAVLSDGDLLLGGQFTIVNTVSRAYLARVNQDGTLDTTFLSGLTGPNGSSIADIIPAGDGKLVLLGSGTQFNGTLVNNFVRITEAGVIDSTYPLGTSPNIGQSNTGYANAAVVRNDGAIVLAGYNMTFKSVALSGLGYLTAPEDGTLAIVAEPAAITQPAGSAVTLTVAARGRGPLTFQWYKDTVAIPDATATSYTIPALGENDAASYTVTVTSGATTQTSAAATVAIGTNGPGGDTFGNYLADAGIPENQRGPNDDPDGDGISNLLEYALAFNPASANASALPTPTVVNDRLTYIYERARNDVTYLVETTTNLADPNSWTTDGVDQGTPDAEGITIASAPLGTQRYFRLKVTRP